MDAIDLQRRLRDLLTATVERLGYDLVAVEWTGSTRGRVLRLSIDKPGGVDADDCARTSEQVSPLLDAEDPIEGRYTLEVSSPGIERPVQRPQDYARFRGFRVKLRLIEGHIPPGGGAPRRRYTGTIGPIEDDELVLTVDGKDHRVPLDAIESAHLALTLEEFQKLAEEPHDHQ